MFPKDTKILVVDDAESMRQYVSTVLGRMGYKNIQYATDGLSAFNALSEAQVAGQPFQLTLSDMNMPGMDGLELVKKVRQTPELKDLPLIIITAERQNSVVVRTVSAGASSYVIKPFNETTLGIQLKAAWEFHHGAAK